MNLTRTIRRSSNRSRRGVVLLTIVVALVVSTAVLGSMLGNVVRTHGACRLRHQERQCLRLAQAALARGAARRADDGDYDGETWIVPADDLAFGRAAQVKIEIDGDTLVATAAYPDGPTPHVRKTMRRTISD